VRTRRIKYA
jgi:hypothetical protein